MLLFFGTVLLLVPFKYVISMIILDLFTRELEFREETVRQFRLFMKDRWAAVTAPPVVVLPYENPDAEKKSQKPPTQ